MVIDHTFYHADADDEADALPLVPPTPAIVSASESDDDDDDDDDDDAPTNVAAAAGGLDDYIDVPPGVERDERLRAKAVRRWSLSCIGCIVGLVLVVGGVFEIIAAEHERRHGWQLTVCHVVNDFGHNDSQCIYFGARPQHIVNASTLCAVPASIASSTSFIDPPACHGQRVVADAAPEVEHWRSVSANTEVECHVPASSFSAVTLSTCVASTTSGHSVAAIVWRTWIERLVYLSRTPREGAAAIEAVTNIRMRTGFSLLAAGAGILAVVTGCVCVCCRPASPRTVARRRHRSRMAAHKMY